MNRWIILLLAMISIESLALFVLERYSNEPSSNISLILGIALYALLGYLIAQGFKTQSMLFIFLMWQVGIIISAVLIEQFTSKRMVKNKEILASLLTIVAAILLYKAEFD
mgnify:FL=1